MKSDRIKNIWKLSFVTAVALFLPVLINYCLLLPGTYIDGNSLAGDIILTSLFYSLQLIIPVLLGRFIMHNSLSEMGFNLNNIKLTWKILVWFIPIWLLLVIIFYVIGLTQIPGFDRYIAHYYIKDKLVMQKDFIIGCLLAGMGEEPLFRGFVVTSFAMIISGAIGINKVKIPLVAILSGVLFSLAHMRYQLIPFQIIYVDGIQLFVTFILGIFWSVMFLKTKSLVGSIIAHMCANTIQIMSGYVVAYFFL